MPPGSQTLSRNQYAPISLGTQDTPFTRGKQMGKLKGEFRSQEHPTGRAPREDLRRNFCAAANFKYQSGCRNWNSGVRSCRSCRIREQGLYPEIHDQHLPRKIFAKLPDSLAPELLQLL